MCGPILSRAAVSVATTARADEYILEIDTINLISQQGLDLSHRYLP